ncbi:hypothetical protein EV356DRAFT_506777 [Viridothelium virens]|uniref:Uncharacterized protein n=1 Tax=Viridothelium virens TaxID=1048519 RepID=A0A6A6H0F6_VIRVR|nr:hypothetical protein EV356DRAFT_506777 [Viridothelium virens]
MRNATSLPKRCRQSGWTKHRIFTKYRREVDQIGEYWESPYDSRSPLNRFFEVQVNFLNGIEGSSAP